MFPSGVCLGHCEWCAELSVTTPKRQRGFYGQCNAPVAISDTPGSRLGCVSVTPTGPGPHRVKFYSIQLD